MVYQSIQFNPFYLVSPGSYPLFTNISLFFDNLFIGLQNILSSFINNNLWYCYILLIFIFSILLIILLFILVIDRQKGYSVKMNNLPNNDNSKKRKRKSENGNSRKKGKGKSNALISSFLVGAASTLLNSSPNSSTRPFTQSRSARGL